MIIKLEKDIRYDDLKKLRDRYTPIGIEMLQNKIGYIVANKILMVRDSIYYRIVSLGYTDYPEENVRKYCLILDTVDYTEEVLNKLYNMSLQELLPTKPSRKVSAEESCTL